jgi:DNA polymerase-3 subunit alpha
MQLTLDILTAQGLTDLRAALHEGEPGNARGEVVARLHLGADQAPQVRLGRDFELDGELADQLAKIEGLANVTLTTRSAASPLRLVA